MMESIQLDGSLIEIDTEAKRGEVWFDDDEGNEISRDVSWVDLVKLKDELTRILAGCRR